MALKRKFKDEFLDDFRPIKTQPSIHGIKEPDDSTSSVGSNNPIYELVINSDGVQSPPFKFEDDDEIKCPPSMADVVTGNNRWLETELTEKKVDEEEEGDWWVKYGWSMIVDDNGFLLGEFRRLDEDLYMNIMMIH